MSTEQSETEEVRQQDLVKRNEFVSEENHAKFLSHVSAIISINEETGAILSKCENGLILMAQQGKESNMLLVLKEKLPRLEESDRMLIVIHLIGEFGKGDARAQSLDGLLNTSDYYSDKFSHLRFSKDFDFLSQCDPRIPEVRGRKLTQACGKMEELMKRKDTYECENDFNIIAANYFDDVIKLLDKIDYNKKNNMIDDCELECVAMFNNKFFASCNKMPDLIVGIKDLYLTYPASLSAQMIMEGKLGNGVFGVSSIGQISCYLRIQLIENQCETSLGMLYNETNCQFFMLKKSDLHFVYQSKLYSLNDNETIKILFHFCYTLSFKNEYLNKFVIGRTLLFARNMSIMSIAGRGGSSIVYGVNVIESTNNSNSSSSSSNNSGTNKTIVSRKALKIYDTSLIIEQFDDTSAERLCKSLFEREKKNYEALRTMDQGLPIADAEFYSFFEPPKKKRRLSTMDGDTKNGILMPYLTKIETLEKKRSYSLQVCLALKSLHEEGYFHGDLFWRNIMVDNSRKQKKIYLVDLQLMRNIDVSKERNEKNFYEYLMPELRRLYNLIGKQPPRDQHDTWKEKFVTDDEWCSIYDDIISVCEKFVRENNSSWAPIVEHEN